MYRVKTDNIVNADADEIHNIPCGPDNVDPVDTTDMLSSALSY